jgi:dihydroorotate dehydrogenase
MVKGLGFADEATALRAVESGENIIPGWRSVPALVGLVEFGSFTRWPRLGNPGTVLWRDEDTRSTQNRVGLKNPGARAAAAFLARHTVDLPPVYGINVAVSPGVTDPAQEIDEVLASLDCFLNAGLQPGWFTLNLSCPNTEDDPGGHQTATRARDLCGAILTRLVGAHSRAPVPQTNNPLAGTPFMTSDAPQSPIPLWIKISPELGGDQYAALMEVCAEVGVQAIIATNTLPRPTPDNPTVTAGVGGGRLHQPALDAVRHLVAARQQIGCSVKIIGCGGVLDGASARAFLEAGADALQYWSALIYRGPLAAARIREEMHNNG